MFLGFLVLFIFSGGRGGAAKNLVCCCHTKGCKVESSFFCPAGAAVVVTLKPFWKRASTVFLVSSPWMRRCRRRLGVCVCVCVFFEPRYPFHCLKANQKEHHIFGFPPFFS